MAPQRENGPNIMARLDLHPLRTEKSAEGQKIQVIAIEGAIDASTVIEFEQGVMGYLQQGTPIVVLSCAKMTYINSTGMGKLINMRDQFEARNGSIELCMVPDKVRTLFSMLGLESLYTIFPTVEEALKKFGVGMFVAPSAASTRRTRIMKKPADKKAGLNFPVKISCANCKTKLRIADAGFYRCPACGIHYSVSEQAKVKAYNTVKPKVVELRVPAEPMFCESIRNAARAVAEVTRLTPDDLAQLEGAVNEAAELVIRKCSEGGRVRFFQTYMVGDEKEFVCGFKTLEIVFEEFDPDAGQANPEDKLALELIRSTVSALEVVELDPQGQLLKLVISVE